MRRVGVLLAALVLAVSACSSPSSPKVSIPKVPVDTPALRHDKAVAGIKTCVPGSTSSSLPDLTLPCLGGGPDVDLDHVSGPLLVNIWFNGCTHCVQEFKNLEKFYAANGSKVKVVGLDINAYEPASDIELLGHYGVTYPQLADADNAILRQKSLNLQQGAPQTIFVDAKGAVTYVQTGAFDSESQIASKVHQYLGVDL